LAEQTRTDTIEEPLKEYGSIGDLGRYAGHGLSLAFNYGFALFVGYVLGEMADDTFLGHYNGLFTWIGLAAGFVSAFFSTRKRLRRFAFKQVDLFERRERKLRGYRALENVEVVVGFSACFAGVSRLCDLIYLSEFSRAGYEWILFASMLLVGGALLVLGLLVLLGKRRAWSPLRWVLLLPIPVGVVLAYLGLRFGARLNVIAAMTLLAETPLIAFFEHLRGGGEEK